MDDAVRTHRTHRTHARILAMDAMRPSQAFGAPPAASSYDARHRLRQLFRTLRDAIAVVTRPRAADGTPTIRVRT